MIYNESKELFEASCKLMPGGVNSPVRAFKSLDHHPLFLKRGLGARVYDVDGHEFIDYVGSWGPLILGHAHPAVVEALQKRVSEGTGFGAPTELELEMAGLIAEAVPSVESVRMVNSGTEATMSALRLARAFTGREKVVKFAGCYHGHADSFLIKAGSGVATLGLADSPGVPAGVAADTVVVNFNDMEGVQRAFEEFGAEIAAVILEPVAGNSGVLPPREGFLQELRALTEQNGALLIFDEVMTGFRVAYGGAQELYGLMPDLTCLGKVIGGGLPVGAYGGRREIMEMMAPVGPVYQAGTLSGNPLAMTAGIETLKQLRLPGAYEALESKSRRLEEGLEAAARRVEAPVCLNRVGSMLCIFFTPGPVYDNLTAAGSDRALFARYFRGMLREGIYLAPSQFEASFVSLAHTDEEIEKTVGAAKKVLEEIFS